MADIIDINVYETTETVAITVTPNLTTININSVTSGSGGVPSLQDVTDVGATTTNSITANSFIKSSGTSSQFLKADGSVDSNIYGIDSNLVHKTGAESIAGLKTFTNGIFANANTETAVIATSSKSYGLIATSNSSVIPSAIFNISQPSNPNEIVRFQKEGTTLASVTNLGSFSGLSFIKTGGTSSQFLKADGSVDSNTYATTSGVILTTTDQTFNGIKSSINTGTSQINGLNLTNNGTTTNTFSIKVLNTNSGFGINAINNLGGNAIQVTNNGYGSGINVDSSDGVGVNIIHSGAAYGLRVDNSGLGEAIHIDNTSNGKAILVRGSTTSNGFLYVGQNDTTNTFTVNKTGDITSNSFIKSGGTSSQFLMADGSVSTGGSTIPTLQQVTTAGATSDLPITITTTSNSIRGISTSGAGVQGTSTSGIGISGLSTNGWAVYGFSINNSGVYGFSTNSIAANFDIGSANTSNIVQFQKDNVNQASISHDGKITANAFIKTGGTSSQYLMADGSVTTGGGGTPTLQQVTTAGSTSSNAISINIPSNTLSPAFTVTSDDINSNGIPSIKGIGVNDTVGVFGTSDDNTGVFGTSIDGNAIVGISTNSIGGVFFSTTGKASTFNINTSNTSNIVEFQKNSINQAYVTHNGTIVSNELLVNTTTDNGVDKLQVNGTASGSAATLSNQFVTKSQLDLKANANEVVKSIVNEFPNSTVNGTTSDTLLSTFTIPAGTLPTSCMPDIRMKFSKSGDGGTAQMRLRINTVNNFATSTQIATYTAALATDTFLVSRNPVISGGNMNIFIATTATQSDTSAVAITESNFTIDVANTIYLFVSVTQGVAGDTTTLKAFKIIN